MLERIPYLIEILVVVVIVQVFFCWYSWKCCKELKAWAKALKLKQVLKCMADATGCNPDDPTWPPDDPGGDE